MFEVLNIVNNFSVFENFDVFYSLHFRKYAISHVLFYAPYSYRIVYVFVPGSSSVDYED
jgi:hypothetical protein